MPADFPVLDKAVDNHMILNGRNIADSNHGQHLPAL